MNSSPLPYARSFRDLVVHQKQRLLSREVFRVTRSFPPEEKYALTDQLRRAARSIGAQIAEAWAKRLYERHFIAKLSDADAEQMETQHWLDTARDDGCLPAAECVRLLGLCEEIGRMLGGMIERAASFCDTSSLQEEASSYFCAEPPATPSHPTEN
jgi:four helix bundle protein